ncbi:MAG: hypothetical protein ACKVOR_11455 [Flavobacteriales bacterium]
MVVIKKNTGIGILAQLFAALVLVACIKEEPMVLDKEYPEFIVFGQYANPDNCFGNADNCVNIFRIDPMGLNEDADSNFPESGIPLAANFSENRSSSAYENVQQLFLDNPPPQALLDMASGTVGTAPEWATNFYFEYKTPSGYKYWIIDGSFDGSLPGEIQSYVNTIQQAINLSFQ